MTRDGSLVNFASGMGQMEPKVGSCQKSVCNRGRRSIDLGNQAQGDRGDGLEGKTISLLSKSYLEVAFCLSKGQLLVSLIGSLGLVLGVLT